MPSQILGVLFFTQPCRQEWGRTKHEPRISVKGLSISLINCIKFLLFLSQQLSQPSFQFLPLPDSVLDTRDYCGLNSVDLNTPIIEYLHWFTDDRIVDSATCLCSPCLALHGSLDNSLYPPIYKWPGVGDNNVVVLPLPCLLACSQLATTC